MDDEYTDGDLLEMELEKNCREITTEIVFLRNVDQRATLLTSFKTLL